MICRICSKDFSQKGNNTTCSKKCSKELRKNYNNQWKKEHYEEQKSKWNKWRNRPEVKEVYNKKEQKRKQYYHLEVIRMLGGECANPFGKNHGDFLKELDCLQIDHKMGQGARDKYKGTTSYYRRLYKSLKENLRGTKNEYQILCANCNWLKRKYNHEYGKVKRLILSEPQERLRDEIPSLKELFK